MQRITALLEKTGTRIMGIALLIILLFMLSFFLFLFPMVEGELFDSRKMAARNLVEAAYNLAANYAQRAESSDMSQARAKQQAIRAIRSMRFSDRGYFWINDTTRPYPRMILHSALPGLEGRVMDDASYNMATGIQTDLGSEVVKLAKGERHLFQVFLRIARKHGEGFVTYDWPKPTADGVTEALYPKESYIKLFAPWGWIIGTGVYIDDIHQDIAHLHRAVVYAALAILLVALLLVFLLMSTITRPIKQLVAFAGDMAGGNLEARVKGRFRGELGELKAAISHMVEQLQSRMQEAENKAQEAEDARQELRENEEKYRILVENAHESIVVAQGGRLRFVNDRTCELTGYSVEELTNRFFDSLVHPEDREMVKDRHLKRLEGTVPDDAVYTFRVLDREGRQKWVELKGVAVEWEGRPATLNFLADITEKKQAEQERQSLEARLRQARKIEALGTLTGGVAHDFNNILNIIMGYSELVENELPDTSLAKKGLKEIQTASLRARDVIRQLLTFSRKGDEAHTSQQLVLIIKEGLRMMRHTLPSSVEIRECMDRDLPLVMASPTQIHQLIVNLCKNASDAMAEKGGVLEVSLQAVVVSEQEAASDPDLSPGGHVKLTVSDTGHGIAAGHMERIFDPYFTTKDVHKGTGLGLSGVLGIVKSHGGAIRVSSEPGEGTRFEIFFPAASCETEGVQRQKISTLPGGAEFILFVDDEASVARLNMQRLQNLGYRVHMETDPEEALRAFAARPERFDLVITDMTMPRMTGDKLSRKIMEIRPDAKIILCTGYSERISEDEALSLGIAGYMEKPVDMQALAEAIRAVLDRENT
ncbi:MAG: cache domain-containing protein [Desulfosalsimonadaceae bacterium]